MQSFMWTNNQDSLDYVVQWADQQNQHGGDRSVDDASLSHNKINMALIVMNGGASWVPTYFVYEK